jgi:mycothiol synthase
MDTLSRTDLDLPKGPPLPGLRYRTYAGEDDIPALVELYAAVNEADHNPEVWTVEQERNELRNYPHVDPAQDFILAFLDGRLVASSSIGWSDTSDGQRLYRSRGWVHPEWRRRGIGGAMLTRNEARLLQLASGHEHALPPTLMTWLEDADVGGHALFAARRYERVRVYHHMVRPDLEAVDTPPLPVGLEVRPVTPDLLPRLWEAMLEAFRDHFGGHPDTPEEYRSWAEDPEADASLWVVAFDGDEIAAGVLGYIMPAENERNGYLRGWTDPVFTRRPWRRRGLAYALLGRCLCLLRERGMTSAQLGVDSQNPNDALTLYQRHRFEPVRGSSEWHKSLEEAP